MPSHRVLDFLYMSKLKVIFLVRMLDRKYTTFFLMQSHILFSGHIVNSAVAKHYFVVFTIINHRFFCC